jgi:peptidyl-prolyl cis-trans isomerase A (cyclophilin A)
MRPLIALFAIALLAGCAAQGQQAPQEQPRDVAVFHTSEGDFEIQLYPQRAPQTVANFERYVDSGFYNGTIFHRVIKGFMIQGGGFLPDGTQKETRPPIALESGNGLNNTVGMVAMARTADPGSATSQFFINTADNPSLDQSPGNPGYAVFGKVVSGMDVVRKIEAVQTWDNGYYQDWPVANITIIGAYMK